MVRQFHPVADLFPLLSGQAFRELAADIKKNGLREPILLDPQGLIIDGRNRYRACNHAGVEPRFVQWQGEGTLPEVALSLNLHRRRLGESQRAMVAARTAKWMEKDAAERRGMRTDMVANLPPCQFGKTRDKAGALVNVSPRLVTSAAKVLRNGCAKLIALVDAGELAVSAAARLAGQRLRRGRLCPLPTPPFRASPGAFGVLGKDADKDRMLLWVDTHALSFTIKTLKSRGLTFLKGRGK